MERRCAWPGPRWSLACAVLLASLSAVAAEPVLKDVAGGKDSPIVSRFAGSVLVGYEDTAFGAERLPLAPEQDVQGRFERGQDVEGRVVALSYLAPAGKTALEVHRNYVDALTRAGFVKKFSCDGDGCGRSAQIMGPFVPHAQRMKQVASYGGYSDVGFLVINGGGEPHVVWGTLKVQGRDVHVLVYDGTQNAVDTSPLNNRAGTFVLIIEPKTVETGQVVVDVNAMQKGIAADGKVALYGVFFETGKADLKPESKPQLDQMAKLLDADRALKVYVVGHTDDQGTLDGNLQLSQRRAEALVAALVKDYRIDPKRLTAKGVASFAPVATNDSEAGRARNRRVELVKQ